MEEPIIRLNLKVIICKIRGYHETLTYRGRTCDYIRCKICKSEFQTHMDKCRFPDFKSLVENCKQKIKSQFPKYGNSWRGERDYEFWSQRLDVEIKEMWNAKTEEEFKKEIVDAINILAMINENSSSWEAHVQFGDMLEIQKLTEVVN